MGYDVHVAIRSYGRAQAVKTLEVVPWATVWVPGSQEAEYKDACGAERVWTIPDDEDGNPGRKSNAILNRSPSRWTLILDDDITGIGAFDGGAHRWMRPGEIEEWIPYCFDIAHQFGVRLWGINQRQDPLLYDTFEPWNFLVPVLGPFTGHLDPVLRYDETVLSKDDYDFFLQNIFHHRMALRFNKYHYAHGHGVGQEGGLAGMRSMAYEQRGITRMQQKWGDKVFRVGGPSGANSSSSEDILNSAVRVPLAGI